MNTSRESLRKLWTVMAVIAIAIAIVLLIFFLDADRNDDSRAQQQALLPRGSPESQSTSERSNEPHYQSETSTPRGPEAVRVVTSPFTQPPEVQEADPVKVLRSLGPDDQALIRDIMGISGHSVKDLGPILKSPDALASLRKSASPLLARAQGAAIARMQVLNRLAPSLIAKGCAEPVSGNGKEFRRPKSVGEEVFSFGESLGNGRSVQHTIRLIPNVEPDLDAAQHQYQSVRSEVETALRGAVNSALNPVR